MQPTIGVSELASRLPILKKNLRPYTVNGADTPTTTADELSGRRYDLVSAKENLEFRISVNELRLQFVRGNDEFWYQDEPVRSLGKEGAEEAEKVLGIRTEKTREDCVMNNEAMRGLSREKVEGKNAAWRDLVEKGIKESVEGEKMEE